MYDFIENLQTAPVAGFIFLITLITGAYDFTNNLAVRPKFILNPYQVIKKKEYYRLITAGLVHGDWMHLAFNMLTYYFFAFRLEQTYLGHTRFLFLYLFCLIAGNLAIVIKYRDVPTYNALGASGAVSGVLFSFILFFPFAQLGLFLVIPIPAWAFAFLYIAFSYYASRKNFDSVAHEAHLWGAVAGFVVSLIMFPEAGARFWEYISYAIGQI